MESVIKDHLIQELRNALEVAMHQLKAIQDNHPGLRDEVNQTAELVKGQMPFIVYHGVNNERTMERNFLDYIGVPSAENADPGFTSCPECKSDDFGLSPKTGDFNCNQCGTVF